MKKALIAVMKDIVSLLKTSNRREQANWFAQELTRIEVQEEGGKEFRATLREVGDRIAGMGSFSDMWLTPRKQSGMSEDEANRRKWALAHQLDDKIASMLKRKKPTARGRQRPAKARMR